MDTSKIIDGNALSKQINNQLKEEIKQIQEQCGIVPGLGAILVGEDPASKVYVGRKEKTCKQIGIKSEVITLPEDVSEEEVLRHVENFNQRPDIHGILVQLPLPKHMNPDKVVFAINPSKDVDGFHPVSIGKMVAGTGNFLPCTPVGCVELIKNFGVDIRGKEAVVIGKSHRFANTVAVLLLLEGAKVKTAIIGKDDFPSVSRQADLVIVAIGQAQLITADFLKEGAVVIDVGVNRLGDKLVGDVDFEGVLPKVAGITPVPGGVGPMTICMLMKNTVISCKLSLGIK